MEMIHLPRRDDSTFETPESVSDPAMCDTELSQAALQAAMLLEDVNLVHAHGALSTAHDETDLEFFARACTKVARRLKPYVQS